MSDNKKLKEIGKMSFVDAHHDMLAAIDAYTRISHNIPKVLIEVSQKFYGRMDDALEYIFAASNSYDNKEKLQNIELAKQKITFQYTSLSILVRTKSISYGQANIVIEHLDKAYKGLSKWANSIRKCQDKTS